MPVVHGLKELNAKLKALPDKLAVKVLKGALMEAAQPILHAARSKAPVDTGLLVSSIKVRSGVSIRRGVVRATVGTSSGDYHGDEFYAAFIEYGHRQGKRTRWVKAKGKLGKLQAAVEKAGDSRPFVPAQPFMRPAFDENKEKALRIFVEELRAGLDAVVTS